VVSAADPPRPLISDFQTGVATFLSSSLSFILTRAEWTPFQIHCYSENLVAPEIEPGTSWLAASNSDHRQKQQTTTMLYKYIHTYNIASYCGTKTASLILNLVSISWGGGGLEHLFTGFQLGATDLTELKPESSILHLLCC
jgi:hypothetical protein